MWFVLSRPAGFDAGGPFYWYAGANRLNRNRASRECPHSEVIGHPAHTICKGTRDESFGARPSQLPVERTSAPNPVPHDFAGIGQQGRRLNRSSPPPVSRPAMIGEFYLAGKPHHFMWDDQTPAPASPVLRIRPCPLKPVLRVTLEYAGIDKNRNVACYNVLDVQPA